VTWTKLNVWYRVVAWTKLSVWSRLVAWTKLSVWYRHVAWTKLSVWYRHDAWTKLSVWYTLHSEPNGILWNLPPNTQAWFNIPSYQKKRLVQKSCLDQTLPVKPQSVYQSRCNSVKIAYISKGHLQSSKRIENKRFFTGVSVSIGMKYLSNRGYQQTVR